MSPWKLPRKAKKAFVAEYGRGAYRALEYLSGLPRFDGVVEVKDAERAELTIGADFNHNGLRVMLISQTVAGMVRVIREEKMHQQGPIAFPSGGLLLK